MRKLRVVGLTVCISMAAFAAVSLADSGSKVVKETTTVSPTQDHAAAKAKCPSGTRPEAIGLATNGDETDLDVLGQRLSGSRTARAALGSFGSDPAKLTSIAYCAKDDFKVKLRSKTSTVPDSAGDDVPSSITAECKKGEHVMFGGFKQSEDSEDTYLAGQYRSGQGWTTKVYNFEAPATVTSYAYCSEDAPKLSTVNVSTVVPSSAKSTETPTCPAGKHVVSGGYKSKVTGSDAFVVLRALQRKGQKTWKVVAHNDNHSSPGGLTAYAYCAKN